MIFKFSTWYFLLALLLFITEVLIALYVHDDFVRPYVGDYLVVMLVYCAVRTLVQAPVLKIAAGVLLFAYLVEVSQYFHLVNLLGLQDNAVAATVMGTGFELSDFVAYTLGVVSVIIIEKLFHEPH